MGWLYCLLDDSHEFAGQIFEIHLLAQTGAESLQGLRRVVLCCGRSGDL